MVSHNACQSSRLLDDSKFSGKPYLTYRFDYQRERLRDFFNSVENVPGFLVRIQVPISGKLQIPGLPFTLSRLSEHYSYR